MPSRTGIIPAYAGSTHLTPDGGCAGCGSSPHTRGALPPAPQRREARRIIPAYAGSTASTFSGAGSPRDHPRIRGEHYVNSTYPALAAGSSPHTRGAPVGDAGLQRGNGIIPAYAGSTWCRWCAIRPGRDHPRIRGEHVPAEYFPQGGCGSSPHTRGAPTAPANASSRPRIIPAYAGSTIKVAAGWLGNADHPRIRGEHQENRTDEMRTPWIIPAYAGST